MQAVFIPPAADFSSLSQPAWARSLMLQVWTKTGEPTLLLSLVEEKIHMDELLITTDLFNYLPLWLRELLK